MLEEREIFEPRGRARVEACCLFSGISSVSNTETVPWNTRRREIMQSRSNFRIRGAYARSILLFPKELLNARDKLSSSRFFALL